MEKQINYIEDVLFNNYMVSSLGEEYVHSQIPFYFEVSTYEKMVYYSEEINKISLEILKESNDKHKKLLNYFDDFIFKDKIFNLKCPISTMFWARYDTFRDVNDRIYFAEFNYDKPCGQKEMHLAGKSNFSGNLNSNFLEVFMKELMEICISYTKSDEKINVGFLMDPCHYEELHHSYYFKHVFKDTNINIVQVGPNNLSVRDGDVYGYSSIKLPIILRLFPTEFCNEISNIEEILECADNGKLLLINDPRIIAIQAKGFFAYLWDLVKEDSNLISSRDKEVITQCIPYTEILTANGIEEVMSNKDNYVVKSSLGRYSQEVYIGKLYTQEEWNTQIKIIYESNKIHVRQNIIDIKQEYTYVPSNNNMNIPTSAFGNFGVYLIKDKVQGFLVRWSENFLTNDNYTWMCPLGVQEFPILVKKFEAENRCDTWNEVIEEIAFKYNFTGAYTNVNEYISLDSLIIKKNLHEEMLYVSEKFCEILKRMYPHIQKNIDIFGKILGIPEKLYKLVSKSLTSVLCALGRIDFVVDNDGNLKILEFNSETPAGLVESIGGNSIVKKKLNIEYEDPNEKLRGEIRKTFFIILEEFKKSKSINNIAVVTSWYYEDIYTSNIISEVLKELKDYNIILGNVYDLKVVNNKIFLYGEEIDAIYRHYPLDWFYFEEEMRDIIEPLNSGDYLINPAHTLITQSKAFLAVIYELLGKNFFSEDEEKFILRYIPYTSVEEDEKLSSDYVIKPYLSREGMGIDISYNKIDQELENIIFQDRVNIKPICIDIYSTMGKSKKYQFPVLGVYITDDKPCGIYTRMGDFITNKNAIYMPTYINQ
ncbi:glutathionylspermidine synthase family protein [Clostridium chromiireducens]|uniref:Glutathionylspermidine synthase n=1 Tax=Clostridium chromiireducens TaxID=225345 RepID=A0A1V4ITV4_9CLOT|nr:glutathionylspermidine synthase family protein [Clostridium chromiireducens]OPJ63471.1 glutathionylspermidine synthase [Clostridium chromiireducens]RII32880.1 glutathionylspermidine synthase [Clostridium chromiireducens]